ncbi:lytic transglycosylase domain-containing protein [Sphingomonas sp. 7/4-4]|uniref:lytic transglycosylase domain-containing protein n=1 Tax=Sphingomonas sp. 7/4-4 TaxID=3018446 RepID=UPI0022F3B05E|nr:lytic transglycosylase domain-containing protein [Sphingomonas sp. 7/4-4]WBY08367.1 lytic transglycosylase domain-containing protein [Sphingomonas sp. 7/4-4]
MIKRTILAAALLALPAAAHADDLTADARPAAPSTMRDGDGVPDQLDADQRAGYRRVFAAIRAEQWTDAQLQLDLDEARTAPRPRTRRNLHRQEFAESRRRGDHGPARRGARPAAGRAARADGQGARRDGHPVLPAASRLIWFDGAPVRQRARSIRSDTAATSVAIEIQPFVKADDGLQAEAVVEKFALDLTPEALTEWQQKVAWIYYVAGDDINARRVAEKAQLGVGDWVGQADWVAGLATWRQGDCNASAIAFERVAMRASDTELRSAGFYWASRADMACGRPEKVSVRLKAAAQFGETYYGLLARAALGIQEKPVTGERFVAEDWRALERRPNVHVAAALTEIGEDGLANEVLRHQAKFCTPGDHASLTRLAGRLNLAATQLWLSHNGPAGAQPLIQARYPSPNWTPAGGWRVDKALVFAHTLQESRFNAEVRSAAGAMGLMQVKTGAAIDVGRRQGVTYAASDLTKPSVNMEIGQSYLEQLRDQPFTQGLLPKVIAAYNAGPSPVALWNTMSRDNGDPLLYIESIPYWETRGYVMTVLRNYWMYENQEGRASASRQALTQGLWPKFPGLPGAKAVKVSARLAPQLTASAQVVGGN